MRCKLLLLLFFFFTEIQIHRLLELPKDFPSTRARGGSTQNGRQPIYGSSLDVEQNYKSQSESVLTT